MKIRYAVFTVLVLTLMLGTAWLRDAALAQPRGSVDFDHVRTGFPLTGAHRLVDCETCHMGGRFKGTPTQCALCHSQGSRIAATVKPANHFPTQLPCDQCHASTSSWSVARFTHAGISPGTCTSCHNGAMAPGKPANHVQTSDSCDACHRTTAWSPAGYNHANVMPGTCTTCHNGVRATGKPASHFVTSAQCDACHITAAWSAVHAYAHVSPYYRQHNSGVRCVACHTGNSEVVTWPFAAYKPDCAGCHAGDFKPSAHRKPDSTLYTADELRNCAGSCHLADGTQNGEHRPTDGEF